MPIYYVTSLQPGMKAYDTPVDAARAVANNWSVVKTSEVTDEGWPIWESVMMGVTGWVPFPVTIYELEAPTPEQAVEKVKAYFKRLSEARAAKEHAEWLAERSAAFAQGPIVIEGTAKWDDYDGLMLNDLDEAIKARFTRQQGQVNLGRIRLTIELLPEVESADDDD